MRTPGFIIGAILLAIAALGIGAIQIFRGSGDSGATVATGPQVRVKGFIGSEKSELLTDATILKILHDKYKLDLDFKSVGSIEMVRDADTNGQDFLWPSNEVAREIYKERFPGRTLKSETIFNSPLVYYSWDDVVDAMIKAGYVDKTGDAYFLSHFDRFWDAIQKDTKWKDLGLPQIFGSVSAISTDPTASNSGNIFAALMANMLNGGQVVDSTSVETQLPKLKRYFDSLGFLETSSGPLFKRFLVTGKGEKPMIVGYENQLIEFAINQSQENKDLILKQIRVVYPVPTIWASHPMIALTANGERLMAALQDTEIQKIAWEKHGFRTGLPGVQNSTTIFKALGIPPTIESVIPMPRWQVMDRIIVYLSR